MKLATILIAVGLLASPLSAMSKKKLLWISLGAFAAASAADVISSRGGYEANPLVRGSDGRFALGRGIAIKIAVVGGIVALESYITHTNLSAVKPFVITNTALSAVTMGAAVRNFKIRREK